MRTFLTISLAAASLTIGLTSCGHSAADSKDKELVYEGSMAEPQIGEQPVAQAPVKTAADSVK